MVAPKQMGAFERGQRFTGLTNQAQLYFEQHKQYAESCEASAKKLFDAVEAITAAQGKTWPEVLGLTGDFTNMVLDGGSEYWGPISLGRSLSYAQWFFLASIVGLGNVTAGAADLFAYAGCTLSVTPGSAPLNVRMKVGATLRLARDPESRSRLTRGRIPWARISDLLNPTKKGTLSVPFIETDLFDSDYVYTDHIKFINDAARIRLDVCAYATMMKFISDGISKLATKAAEQAKDPRTALEFDIAKEFGAVIKSLIASFDKVHIEALERVQSYDRIYQKGYTSQDPELTTYSFDLKKAAPSPVIRLDVSSDFAVDTLWAETADYNGQRFGGCGGKDDKIFFEDGELITAATWKTGKLASNTRKRLIYDLTITTTKRTLGPYGTGGAQVRPDSVSRSFQVPDGMEVYGLVDMAGKFIEHRGDIIMESGPYVSKLRFIVGPARVFGFLGGKEKVEF